MIIYEFRKNYFEKVIIQFKEYKGKLVIDIRAHYKVSETVNEWKPSKKGICMSVYHLGELLKGLQLAHEKWEKETKKEKWR